MSAISITRTELWRLSAAELAAAIRSKEVSSQEGVEAHLRRIEAALLALRSALRRGRSDG